MSNNRKKDKITSGVKNNRIKLNSKRGIKGDKPKPNPKKIEENEVVKRGKKRKQSFQVNVADIDEQSRGQKRPKITEEMQDETEISTQSCSEAIQKKNPSIDKAISLTPLSLSETYDVTSLSINSGSKIHTKVTQALKILSNYPAVTGTKDSLVLLVAKPNACCKMISIAEIVKREIKDMEGKWFQYNVLEQELVKKEEKNQAKEKDEIKSPNQNEDTENFEIMKTPFERAINGVPKVRLEPLMKIYLSRVRIEDLRKVHGEQTNGISITNK
ncbi:hypothetical protein OnM2_026054 [Erysiphe neolycopersici]|uniref:DNA/RNA-binding protein Alba-like domain-containing protein n=1 Tax=Erysiphe neolycopersici TaxID=212602 RepID=A0A420I0R7_9PEZI|nr:hypothetical protein OnM2_026054 [Erysiphe neolycopersici]